MDKVGRNDPCPCGSGKKYKKCHGAPAADAAWLPVSQKSATVKLLGLPGQLLDVSVSFRNDKDPSDPMNRATPKGAPGDYEVYAVLARPGAAPVAEGQVTFSDALEGDSHLAIAKPACEPPGNPNARNLLFDCATDDGKITFMGHANAQGFLGKFVSGPFRALDHRDAQRRAYRALSSSLSNLALLLDIPLGVFQIESKEMATDARLVRAQAPFRVAPLVGAEFHALDKDFRGYASLYREALGGANATYRFLCLYKIIEGVRNRRIRLAKEAKEKGAALARPPEVIPSKPEEFEGWLNAIYLPREWDPLALNSIFLPEVLGRKFGKVIDDELNPLRVAVAHALTEDGELTHSADELLHIDKTNKWLPITTCIARWMLRHEFPDKFAFLGPTST